MFEWLLLVTLVALICYAFFQVQRSLWATEAVKAEFWVAVAETNTIELEYGSKRWPEKEHARFAGFKAALQAKFADPQVLGVGDVAFRFKTGEAPRLCKILAVDKATVPASVTVRMGDDKSEVGTELSLLRTAVQMAMEHKLPGQKRDDGSVEALPWQRVLPEPCKKELHAALLACAVKLVALMFDLQSDKPGFSRLWSQKRISDRFWNSVLEAEARLEAEIHDAQREAECIEAGAARQVMQAAVATARDSKEKQNKDKKREDTKAALAATAQEIELAKARAVQQKLDAEKAAVRQAADAKKAQERAAEEMAKQLIEEETRATKKGKKKKA